MCRREMELETDTQERRRNAPTNPVFVSPGEPHAAICGRGERGDSWTLIVAGRARRAPRVCTVRCLFAVRLCPHFHLVTCSRPSPSHTLQLGDQLFRRLPRPQARRVTLGPVPRLRYAQRICGGRRWRRKFSGRSKKLSDSVPRSLAKYPL